MNLEQAIDKLKEDRDVVEPFARRLLQRIQERHPDDDIRLCDIDLTIGVRRLNGAAQIHRMLGDLLKEGVSI